MSHGVHEDYIANIRTKLIHYKTWSRTFTKNASASGSESPDPVPILCLCTLWVTSIPRPTAVESNKIFQPTAIRKGYANGTYQCEFFLVARRTAEHPYTLSQQLVYQLLKNLTASEEQQLCVYMQHMDLNLQDTRRMPTVGRQSLHAAAHENCM